MSPRMSRSTYAETMPVLPSAATSSVTRIDTVVNENAPVASVVALAIGYWTFRKRDVVTLAPGAPTPSRPTTRPETTTLRSMVMSTPAVGPETTTSLLMPIAYASPYQVTQYTFKAAASVSSIYAPTR